MDGNFTVAQNGPVLGRLTKRVLLLAAAVTLVVLFVHALPAAEAAPCGPVPCYITSDGSAPVASPPAAFAMENKYRWIDNSDVSDHSKPTFAWTEISVTGAVVPGPTPSGTLGRQTYSISCIPIGFDFAYYGNSYNCAWVSSNGMIVLDQLEVLSPPAAPADAVPAPVVPGDCPAPAYPYAPNTFCAAPVALPSGAAPSPMVAGFWVKDADPTVDPTICGVTPTGNAGVFYKTVGNRFIVEYNSVLVLSGDTPTVNCPNPPPPAPVTCTMAPHAKCYWLTFQIQLLRISTVPGGPSDLIEVVLKDVETPEQKPDSGSPIPNYASLGINPPAGIFGGLNYRYGYLCQTPSPNNNAAWNNCYQNRAIRYHPNHLPYVAPLITILEDPATAPTVHLAYDYECAPDPCMVAGTGDTGSCYVTTIPPATKGVVTPGLGPALADPPGPQLPDPPCERTFMPAPHFCTVHASGTPVDIPMTITDQVYTPATPPAAVTAKIAVTCINDAPLISSTPGTTVTGIVGSLASYSGFATGIGSGPSVATDEVTQAMDFPLVSPPPFGTFSSLPVLTRSGGPTSGFTAKLSFVGAIQGTYPICFRAHDNGLTANGGVDTSVNQLCFDITILPGDGGDGGGDCGALDAQFVVTGAPLEANEPISFTDQSTDDAGTIESWEWDFGDGYSSSIPSTTHTYLIPGMYTVRLVVVDSGGCASFRDKTIDLHAPGTYSGTPSDPGAGGNPGAGGGQGSPVLDAGEDQVVREGVLVRLGAFVKTGGQDSVIFTWRQASGSRVTLLNGGSANPEFMAPVMGTNTQPIALLFGVRGNDGLADSLEDFVKVTVIGRDQHMPIADAGKDVTVVKGDAVTLDGAGSVDPDGDAITYAWSVIGGADVASLPGQGRTVAIVTPADAEAAYIDVKLVVSDGGFQAADTMRIWLQTPSLESKGFHATNQPDGSVIFTANTLAHEYIWNFGDGVIKTTTEPSVRHKYNATGDYEVTLRLGSDAAPRSQPVHAEVPPAATGSETSGPTGSALMLGVFAAIFGAVLVAALLFFALRGGNKRVP